MIWALREGKDSEKQTGESKKAKSLRQEKSAPEVGGGGRVNVRNPSEKSRQIMLDMVGKCLTAQL